MSKRVYRTYSTELKQKVVEEYLSGRGSLRYLAKLHQIGDKKSIREWIMCFAITGVLLSGRSSVVYWVVALVIAIQAAIKDGRN